MKLLRLLPLVALLSCEKEVVIGPRGPQGNANVQSGTYTVADWIYHEPSYYGEISVPFITEDIVREGAVLVYVETGINTFSQLPLTIYRSEDYSTTLEVLSRVRGVRIVLTDSDLIQPLKPRAMDFKVVAIASSELLELPDVDWTDYNAVQSVLNSKQSRY